MNTYVFEKLIARTVAKTAIICLLVFLQDESALGGFVLAFNSNGTNATFQVQPETQSLEVPVFLVQNSGETRLTNIGLFAAGATISFQSGPGLSTYSNGSARYSSGWENTTSSFAVFDSPLSRVRLQGLMTNTALMTTSELPNSIQIGSFRVTGGSLGTQTVLSISLEGLVSDAILLDNGTRIAPGAAFVNQVTFASGTITAVPEPSTLILVGLAASSMGAAAWRKRKRLLTLTQMNG